ncbi:MAG: histidinol-phosphate transaminase [Proteobacteria bacterium]|nr:histidinol-phosphate transaminase [Pseudomonadota bacterium]MDA0952144.1 histidinol-phosphate transaminase [Pseudomonadota bacterium]
MTTPLRAAIAALPDYSYAPREVPGVARVIQLGQNELGVPPSPLALAALGDPSHHVNRYADDGHDALRAAIGRVHGLDPKRIMVGSGSMELMSVLAQTYCEPGAEVVVSQYGYKWFQVQCAINGATIVSVPEPEMVADIDGLLAAVTPATRLLFLVNPNNPTGALLPVAEVERLAAALPPHVLLLLDCAYVEFAPAEHGALGGRLVDGGGNVVMLRTLSKAYGLAGLRVGWMYGPEPVIAAMGKVRIPGSVPTPCLAAAAAAVVDQAHMVRVRDGVIALREEMRAEAASLGMEALPSAGNFVLLRLPGGNRPGAGEVVAALLERGIVVRAMGSYRLDDCLRISIGTAEEMALLRQALRTILNPIAGT